MDNANNFVLSIELVSPNHYVDKSMVFERVLHLVGGGDRRQEGSRKIKDVFKVFQRVLSLVGGGDGRAGRLVGHLRTLGVQQHLEDRQRGTTGDLFRSETTPRSTCGGGFRGGLS